VCEDCTKRRRENWQEIRDLLNYKRPNTGPLSTQLHEWIAEYEQEQGEMMDDEERAVFTDAIRAEMIAVRCGCIARDCPNTTYHQEDLSDILAGWAGKVLQKEIELKLESSPFGKMLFQAMFGNNEENDDDE